ncbi:MAG: serine hydrolase, partial [Candidatus Dormibacteraceae bacterium]
WGWAAGAMISDIEDMHTWARVLGTGTLLTPKTQAQRVRFVSASGETGGSGYGLGMFDIGGWIGHNGSLFGYQTLVVYLPAKKASLVILINSDVAYKDVPLSTHLGEAITKVISPGNVYTVPPPAAASTPSA